MELKNRSHHFIISGVFLSLFSPSTMTPSVYNIQKPKMGKVQMSVDGMGHTQELERHLVAGLGKKH